MSRKIGDPPSWWEAQLPAELLRLPEELARMDTLLDDPAFFAPFAPHFHPVLGRPSTPVECCLRLMFVKFRYGLGYESLCAEVSDSISWRRSCRIGLDAKVPSERERPAQDPMPLSLMVAAGSTGTRNRTSVTQAPLAPPAPPAPQPGCPAPARTT